MHTKEEPMHTKDNPAKVSFASMIGTAVESCDSFIYGTASAAYFGTVFS